MSYDDLLATLPPEAFAPPQWDAEVPQLIWPLSKVMEWGKQQVAADANQPANRAPPASTFILDNLHPSSSEPICGLAGGGIGAPTGEGIDAPQIKIDCDEAPARARSTSATLEPPRTDAVASTRTTASASSVRTRRSAGKPSSRGDRNAGRAAGSASSTTRKWGRPKGGFATFPNLIIRNQVQLGLECVDLALLLHLASYWFDADLAPWPSKATLAAAIGRDETTVRRRIKAMEEKGFVRRIYRITEAGDSDSNKYDLTGLVSAAEKIIGRPVAIPDPEA